VKTVTDRYIHAAHHNKHWWRAFWIWLINIDDLEWPWTPKRKFLANFSRFWPATNCIKMARDIPRQPAHEIFSIKRKYQQSKLRPPRFTEACAIGLKDGYLLPQVVISTLLARSARKQLQMDRDILLVMTSTGDELFNGVNIDDFEWPWTHKIHGGPKKLAQFLYTPITSSNINRFSIFFIVRIRRKFVVAMLLKIPPHFICVATLPCERSDIALKLATTLANCVINTDRPDSGP